MSEGVATPDKPKVRGRGRGMARKTSNEGAVVSDGIVDLCINLDINIY